MKGKFLHLFIFLLIGFSAFAQVNITFELNTQTISTISPDGIYIAGGSGFGSPGDNQLTDPDGDGIYSITIQKDVNFSSNYIFLNGNCPDYSCKEGLAGLPCSDPANFDDRFIGSVMSDTTVLACFNTCDNDGSCTIITDSVDITFELNTELITVDAAGMFIAGGGNFGNPGDFPMVDPDGDGIYSITVRRQKGFTSNYTFTNGACPDYSCKEGLGGLPCGDPAAFNDRTLPAVMNDTTIMACFGTCDTDGGCTIITDSVEITFQLNTANITVDPGGIFIAGGGNFGNPGDNPMIDPDGDGIYTFTTTRAQGFASHYTFTNGNCPDFTCKEDLMDLPCGDPMAFNDRFLSSAMTDMTIQACFGNCADDGTCDATSINGLTFDKNLFELRPSLVNDFTNLTFGESVVHQEKQIVVMNTVGQILHTATVANETTYQLNTFDFPSGIYFVNVKADKTMMTKKFVVQK